MTLNQFLALLLAALILAILMMAFQIVAALVIGFAAGVFVALPVAMIALAEPPRGDGSVRIDVRIR